MKIVINQDKLENILLFLYFFIGSVAKIGNIFWVKALAYSVWIIIVFLYAVYTRKKIYVDLVVFYFVFICIYSYGIINNYEFISTQHIYAIFIYLFPTYYVMRTAGTEELKFERMLFLSAYCNMAIYIPLCVSAPSNSYMDYAYGILLNTCIIILKYLEENKVSDIVIGSIGGICAILYCSRGAVVVLVAMILYFCVSSLWNKKYKFPTLVIIGLIALWCNMEKLLLFMSNNGIESRNINKFLSSSFFESLGRSVLNEKCIGLILKNPWGYGILSNRKLLYPEPYPHNWVYEIFIDYGHYLGVIIILLISIIGIYLITNNKIKTAKIAIIFYLIGISIQMISNSLYYTNYFTVALALCMNIRQNKLKCRE